MNFSVSFFFSMSPTGIFLCPPATKKYAKENASRGLPKPAPKPPAIGHDFCVAKALLCISIKYLFASSVQEFVFTIFVVLQGIRFCCCLQIEAQMFLRQSKYFAGARLVRT
jgi:hypothetical protein